MAVKVVHHHFLSLEIFKAANAVAKNQIIFTPRIVALRDMNIRIAVKRAPGVKIVMVS
jgi:hypothetical protein